MRSGRFPTCRSRTCSPAARSGCRPTAASRTRASAEAPAGGPVVCVACSGGLDSTALLQATAAAARPLGVGVVALHVHHGLMPEADRWQEAVREHAAIAGVGFAATSLAGRPVRGDSVEAWARAGRYSALARLAQERGSALVLLAHHRRDQAETFLLQALRGAGAAGLAAMPRLAVRDGITWARPWLDVPRDAIAGYAAAHGLRGVDDPSNRDLRFARSRLRSLWPAFVAAFPDAEATLAASARRIAAARDAADARSEALLPGLTAPDGSLDLAAWRALEDADARTLVLHAWLGDALGAVGAVAPATLVERLLREVDGRGKRWPAPGGALASRRGRLVFEPRRATGTP